MARGQVGGGSSAVCCIPYIEAPTIELYAAPVWREVLNKDKGRKKIEAVQRRIALRVCSAYRTVSGEAALVVAGIPPIDLLAKERQEVFEEVDRAEARRRVWDGWQSRWETTSKGSWTRRLIPNVKEWVERRHGEVNYYLTQVLTGHGSFGEYLLDIGKRGSRECVYCGEVDDVGHTGFRCPRWDDIRRRTVAERQMEVLSEDTVTGYMLESIEKWACIERMMVEVMQEKETEERELEMEPA